MPKQKKNKKTKADIESERLAKEIEERDRRVAEETRVKALKEEDERRKAEAALAFRTKEVQSLVEEFNSWNDELLDRLDDAKRSAEANEEWEAYTKHPSKWPKLEEPSLNEFLSILSDEIDGKRRNNNENNDICSSLSGVERVIQILNDINCKIRNSPSHPDSIENLRVFIRRAWKLAKKVLQNSIESVILRRDNYIDSEAGHVRMECKGGSNAGSIVWMNTNKNNSEQRKVEFAALGLVLDVSEVFLANGFAINLNFLSVDYNEIVNDHTNESDSFVIGKVYELAIYKIPKAANKIGTWSVMSIPCDDVKVSSIGLSGSSTKTSASSKPLQCRISISPETIIPEKTALAYWGDNDKMIPCDPSDVTYDKSSRAFHLSMAKPGFYAAIAPRNLDFPFTNWSIYPTSSKEIVYSLNTKRFKILISICDEGCMLLESQVPELQTLCNMRRKPSDLLYQLRRRGIHVMPSLDDLKYSTCLKEQDIELRVYHDLSLSASSFHFTSDKKNRDLGSDKVCYNIKETGIFAGKDALETSDLALAYTERDSTSKSAKNASSAVKLPKEYGDIKVNLFQPGSNTFDDTNIIEGSRSFMYLHNALKESSSTEFIDDLPHTNAKVLRYDALYEVLRLTRPLLFTV